MLPPAAPLSLCGTPAEAQRGPEQVRQNGFKIETQGKVYYCQAPDEMSLQAWMAALRPLKVGFLMKQGQQVQSWKKRWCMLWRTQLAYFENHADTKDRKGYILLRDTIPDRVFAVDRSVFGHDNIFQVETRERTFFMQVRLTALSPLPLISSYKPESPCADRPSVETTCRSG